MEFRRRQVTDQYPANEHGDQTLLVVLQTKTSPWIDELKAKAVPALKRDIHYASLSIGFKGALKPYVVVEFKDHSRHSLERRWILSQFYRSIKHQFQVKNLCVVLQRGAQTTHDIAMAEDGYLAFMQANDLGNDWQSFEVLQISDELGSSDDPHGSARWEGVLGYRRWINENPDELTSIEMGHRLAKSAKELGCSFEELGLDELKAEGMNLLLAVGQGAERSPSRCFIVGSQLQKGKKPLMLLGKGITFDTGGINLKAHENFVNAMKNDMGGAALMAHLFFALVKSGFDRPLLLVIPACENAIGAKAMKPGVLIKSHKGIKVVVEHTDAEGRLILADAMSYAHSRFHPSLTLSAATLTTASLRQFTGYFTAVHFAHAAFQQGLHKAGMAWGERFSCWEDFLPFKVGNSSKAGDLTNLGRLPSHASMGGGSNVAAHFLREFASHPLVHFDIFATCWNWSGDYPGSSFGATGAPFNSLFELLRHQPEALSL